jgi:hypothetical protein
MKLIPEVTNNKGEYMMTCTCDFKDCNNPVKDTRKIYICRMNPQDIYFRFHVCYECLKVLKKNITDNLSGNAIPKEETLPAYDPDKPF